MCTQDPSVRRNIGTVRIYLPHQRYAIYGYCKRLQVTPSNREEFSVPTLRLLLTAGEPFYPA